MQVRCFRKVTKIEASVRELVDHSQELALAMHQAEVAVVSKAEVLPRVIPARHKGHVVHVHQLQ